MQMATYLIEQNRVGKYPLEKLIKTYDVKDFDQAIKDMKEGKTVKPVILW
jgi:Zn-dependent alcohol dehydrogenase